MDKRDKKAMNKDSQEIKTWRDIIQPLLKIIAEVGGLIMFVLALIKWVWLNEQPTNIEVLIILLVLSGK